MKIEAGLRVEAACLSCGAAYQAIAYKLRKGLNTTCSKPCAIRLRALKITRGADTPCPICGKLIHVEPWRKRLRQKVTCSEACQAIAHSQHWAERRRLVTLSCPTCKGSFQRLAYQIRPGKQPFCSAPCAFRERMAGRRLSEEQRRLHVRLESSRKRARRATAPIRDFTAGQWRTIKLLYNSRCAYCCRTMDRLTIDHVIPLSKGGGHTASNIEPACRSCNSRKKDHLWPPVLSFQYSENLAPI